MEISKHTSKKSLGATPGTKEFNDLYFDKQEVLQIFKISSRTLQDWRKYNKVTFIRIGNKTYYLKESLDNLIASNLVPAENESDAGPTTPEEILSEKKIDIPAGIYPSQAADTRQSTSFVKVWDPIPGYMVPVLTMVIYFTPFIDSIIKGDITDPFYFLLPLMVGGVGCGAYLLLQIGIAISKRIVANRKNS